MRIHGDGSQRRCFRFESDVVSPLRQMATEPRCVGEVINVGPALEPPGDEARIVDGTCPVDELVEAIGDGLGLRGGQPRP